MSDQSSKPREFIISERPNGLGLSVMNYGATYHASPDRIYYRVIEKSFADKLDSELASLRAENSRLKDDVFTLKLECDDLRDDNRTHFLKINEMQKERDELQSKLEAAEREIENLTSDLTEMLAQNTEFFKKASERDELKAEVGRWRQEASTHARVADHCAAEKLTLQSEVERLNKWGREKFAENVELRKLNNRYRTALEKYGQHSESCCCRAGHELYAELCDCGLDEALADAPETGPSKDEVLERLVKALEFVDIAIYKAYVKNWSEDVLRVLVYDCKDKIKTALEAAKGKV